MQNNTALLEIEKIITEASNTKQRELKSELGQFFTGPDIARFMADMFITNEPNIKLLDPGAGAGILSAAFIEHVCTIDPKPESIELVAVEVDNTIITYLTETLDICANLCKSVGVEFSYRIINEDFLDYAIRMLNGEIGRNFNTVIMNPPYKKIHANSKPRRLLRELGIETSNLYTGFVAAAKRLLENSGQMVAITPRSFCNGTYFRAFRADFLSDMTFSKIHIFESRKDAFSADEVLQENIIYLARKNCAKSTVNITTSAGSPIKDVTSYEIAYDQLIQPNDKEKFIRIIKNNSDLQVKSLMEKVTSSLADLSLSVSTGKIVDFRSLKHITTDIDDHTIPLVYPFHFSKGYIEWPSSSPNKPDGFILDDESRKMLIPNGNYVLVRRFSSKEEPKRIITAIWDETKFNTDFVGFENHVNYFHINNTGLPIDIAKGLAIYLSSSIIDQYFRQFNGHTQVNVGDLKSLPYPSYNEILAIGSQVNDDIPSQEQIDTIVTEILGLY